ncbi:retrovirus-related pol polyprotein from transposon TNT 1-94 [Tanacetum coccineum]|uniref:Retrovirus-related pol polyprotein from transposon TNT 1-94 n=1 Tax=Tanacetum coccineum TaxID=301880 RepID=A0ABQ5H6W7_9ASTR
MDENGIVIKNNARLVAQAYMGFMVYQIDVKSAFLNRKILKEVYVQQPPGFESSEYPNHVYFKGISIYQEKYVKDLLKKYDLDDYASVKCPMLPLNNLGPDESGVSVNETLYQANPKESHLVAVKRNFRYLKGTPNLGLWYPKGSGGCQILEGKLVCWSAKKQSSVAMSLAEAEYVAAAG